MYLTGYAFKISEFNNTGCEQEVVQLAADHNRYRDERRIDRPRWDPVNVAARLMARIRLQNAKARALETLKEVGYFEHTDGERDVDHIQIGVCDERGMSGG
jgi:hypothetical protein